MHAPCAYFAVLASHFFMKDAFAAPLSGLPFDPMVLASQSDDVEPFIPASHFFINDVLAAPESGLPSLPIAFASQFDGAGWAASALAAPLLAPPAGAQA